MTDDENDRSTYTRSPMPDPAQMSPRYTQPGRMWLPLHGPYKGLIGAEYCATHDFQWLGLLFPGETEPRVFSLDDLEAAD